MIKKITVEDNWVKTIIRALREINGLPPVRFFRQTKLEEFK